MQCERVKTNTHRFDIIVSMLEAASLPVDDLNDPDVFMFAYIDDQSICGAVGLQSLESIALLRSLVVAPEYRGRGLGHMLTAFAEGEASSRNFNDLYLLTDSAERFFERRGYESLSREDAPMVVQKTPQFSTLCPASARLMCLHLTSRRGS